MGGSGGRLSPPPKFAKTYEVGKLKILVGKMAKLQELVKLKYILANTK